MAKQIDMHDMLISNGKLSIMKVDTLIIFILIYDSKWNNMVGIVNFMSNLKSDKAIK